jgi:hypothetical protein
MVINKNIDNDINGTFNITYPQTLVSGRVWRFNNSSATISETNAIGTITNNSFTYTVPKTTVCHMVLKAVCTSPPVGDLNGDCLVDLKDLDVFTDQWLYTGDCSADPNCADINGNNTVDFVDFAWMGLNWGM